MSHYAIAFDLDSIRMKNQGVSDSERTRIYQTEIPNALTLAGFPVWIQGSVYRTETDQNSLRLIANIQNSLKRNAPNFCKFVKSVHVFRVEDISDLTDLISTWPVETEDTI